MVFDGKTYRNLQDQVAYLTSMLKTLGDRIEEVAAQIPSKMIVEELPETGDPLITYYVGPKGTDPNQYYEVWIWVQEEPDGPFVWRELEDTDHIDLSGYLEKQTGSTTYDQAYVKTWQGEQVMKNMTSSFAGSTIAARDADGRLRVSAPSNGKDAANKEYVDDNFLTKNTSVTTRNQVYVKNADGSQGMLPVTGNPETGSIPLYLTNGRLNVGTPTEAVQVANKGYVDDNFVAKQSGATSYKQVYAKNTDGTQYMQVINGKDMDAAADRIAYFGTDGRLRVGTPVNDKDAAPKKYVDAAVGQLLYLHDIVLAYDIDGTNSLFIRCFLISESATALTTLSRENFARLTIGAGGIGTGESSIATPCAIIKLTESFRFGKLEDAYHGFLYQHFSGGALVSASVEDGANTLTVTDSVTTW